MSAINAMGMTGTSTVSAGSSAYPVHHKLNKSQFWLPPCPVELQRDVVGDGIYRASHPCLQLIQQYPC